MQIIKTLKKLLGIHSTTKLPEQKTRMVFDPVTGQPFKEETILQDADAYRSHRSVPWLYNPWSGTKRTGEFVGLDPYMVCSMIDSLCLYNVYTGERAVIENNELYARPVPDNLAWLYDPCTGEQRSHQELCDDLYGRSVQFTPDYLWNDRLKHIEQLNVIKTALVDGRWVSSKSPDLLREVEQTMAAISPTIYHT